LPRCKNGSAYGMEFTAGLPAKGFWLVISYSKQVNQRYNNLIPTPVMLLLLFN